MDKAIFRKTEKRLYNYFNQDKKLKSINFKVNLLRDQVNQIEYRIKSTDINIPADIPAIDYSEKVQSSTECTSYVEKTMIKIIEDLIIERSRIVENINKLEKEIRNIMASNAIIEFNLKYMREEDLNFLKLKYKEGLKDWQVGQKLGMSQSTATRTRQNLVENVANWEEFIKIVH
ncbi:hypothetical protein [Clostridium ihumii]|uniref:hypothetical protein n=1 Tax=Clostridium ihumii TaxID=1470356 RepID=UPI00058C9C22|nr:hypothetical protein [Clostridium ihumii]